MPRKHKKKKKTPKEKVVYYDDGSTVVDMSDVRAPGERKKDTSKPRSTAREKWSTYWAAVKKMVGPMLIVLAAMTVVFLILYFVAAK